MSKTLLPWEKNCANLPTLFINGKSKMMKSMWKKAAMAVVLATVAAGQNGQAMWGNGPQYQVPAPKRYQGNDYVARVKIINNDEPAHVIGEIINIHRTQENLLEGGRRALESSCSAAEKQFGPSAKGLYERFLAPVDTLSYVAFNGYQTEGTFEALLDGQNTIFKYMYVYSQENKQNVWGTSSIVHHNGNNYTVVLGFYEK